VRIVSSPPAAGVRPPAAGGVRTLRSLTGLVLAVYVGAHLVNHALGVISIDAQEALLDVLAPVWQSVPGTLVLYSALVTHAALGLYALWRRRTLRMPGWEFAQLALGLAIPLLLMPHVFATRVTRAVLDVQPTYHTVISGLWSNPAGMVRQPLLVLIVWTHLVIGLHFWLRLRKSYRRALVVLYPLAILVPVLALLGFYGAGVQLHDQAARTGGEPAAPAAEYGYGEAQAQKPVDPAAKARLQAREELAFDLYGGLLVLVLLGRAWRHAARVRGATYRIHHSGGRVIAAPIGHSLLEALRDAGIPHASVCGGRARCTTCRVRVGKGARALPAPMPLEASALARIRAGADVRLACQLRPSSSLHVTPLVPPHAGPSDVDARRMPGRERAVAVMFVDLRESSRLGEQRMPYDVFFILNRFFAEMSEALRETGGYYSTFNGDGLMALYGTETELARGCRDALRGAIAIEARLAKMNLALRDDLGEPLRAGIGIHAGDAIVGTMGPPATPLLSALGDTVNVAARLEAETKRRGCALVVSAACARAAAVDLSRFPVHTVTVRGRREPVTYHAVHDAAGLAAVLADAAEADAKPSSPDSRTRA
jgi:adenylate cyclase